MPIFTPPTIDDQSRSNYPESQTPADLLLRHYADQKVGQTVWKDPQGVWHTQAYPYQGGNTYPVYYDGVKISETSDDPNISIANGNPVYTGGHVHIITDAEATELTAAGFGAFIT